jgi:hypothetical protein
MILECVCQLERLLSLSHTLPEMLGCLSQPDMLEFWFQPLLEPLFLPEQLEPLSV